MGGHPLQVWNPSRCFFFPTFSLLLVACTHSSSHTALSASPPYDEGAIARGLDKASSWVDVGGSTRGELEDGGRPADERKTVRPAGTSSSHAGTGDTAAVVVDKACQRRSR